MNTIDLILYNGKILTMDGKNTIANWVAIGGGRIIALGQGLPNNNFIKVAKEGINLKGKIVLPGFYDSHVHLVQTGLNALDLDLSSVSSLDQLFNLIRRKVQNTPASEFIRGIGFDESKIKEGRLPIRHELDYCAPNHPLWINRIEYHTSIVNSLALHKLNLPYNLEGICRDERGVPNGVLMGKANAWVRNSIFQKTLDNTRKKGAMKVLENAVRKGITSLNAMEGGFTFHDMDAAFILKNQNIFPIDITLFYQTVDIEKVLQNNLKRIGGCIFVDGSFGSRTAALSRAYTDKNDTLGELYFEQDDLNDFVLSAHKNNLQITLHAIGTRAIDQVLNAYENAQRLHPRGDSRHRIEHFELPSDEHIERARQLGLILSMQPAYELYWGYEGGMYEIRLGEERGKNTNPLKKIVEKGICIAGGSDSDVTPMNPLLGVHAAVNHPKKEFSLDRIDALKMFTINGARAVFEERQKGSIEIGKYGDLVIIEDNPLEIEAQRIKDIQVKATVKEGKILFQV
ncbi:amidohydrolase [Geosporobacter ferrireducens]|nr:amidohydrolase [Geosporobacter ferrireducens]